MLVYTLLNECGVAESPVGLMEEGREDDVMSFLFRSQKHDFKTLTLMGNKPERVKLALYLDNKSTNWILRKGNSEIVISLM